MSDATEDNERLTFEDIAGLLSGQAMPPAPLPAGSPEPLGEEVTELPVEVDKGAMPEICKKLSGRQRNVVRYHVQGIRRNLIAKTLHYTEATVTNILCSEAGRAFKEYLSGRLDDSTTEVAAGLQQNALAAMVRIVNIATDPTSDPSLAARCSFDILDRAGHKPATQVVANISHNVINDDDLARIKKADALMLPEVITPQHLPDPT